MSGGQEGKLSCLFCAVLCATVVHSELHTHMNRPNSSLNWVLSHCAHFTVLRFIFVYVLFCVWLYITCMCSIVTWWGGPGGIEAWSLGPLLPSVLWHCWLGHLTCKNPSPIWPNNVFSGSFNPTQSIGLKEDVTSCSVWRWCTSRESKSRFCWKNNHQTMHACVCVHVLIFTLVCNG